MGILKNILEKMKARKEMAKQYQNEQRIQEVYQERKLSANERELMNLMEKDRQEVIKRELERRRKEMQHRWMSGKDGNPAYLPNVVHDDKNLFRHTHLFSGKPNKPRRIFHR